MQYGPPTPIEQNKPLEDSTTPFRQKETPVDLWRHMNSDHLGYRASEWALLGVERRDVRSKYIFTLLHWPTLTMFAWPLDAKDPKMQGACFLTQIDKDASGTDVSGLVRVSLRVLEEVVRAWLRYVRSNPSLRHGRIFAEDADILAICQALFLSPASAAHRHEWLQQQRIPDVPSSLPPSRPSSPDRSSARRTASPKSTALSGMPSHLHS
ncbi:hypothetical protein ACI68E_002388 [Malassezia pachydermatis]|uniref:Uncharacterized protein n=1 Tax=Malassezia pachydermatis TaxID=77020 RepID=A0A0M9VPV0_9BASI|nr:hypothetical protein Malapachy_0787 [Malassezia pachydermatis]KOS14842.1 hypothetical protein Malapachy_0787 [Malassezia pachydermatis]